jgi:hypothetical protein
MRSEDRDQDMSRDQDDEVDLWDLAERMEEAADAFAMIKPDLELALLKASYLIRLSFGDVGILTAYWDDERFAEEKERDYRPQGEHQRGYILPEDEEDAYPDPSPAGQPQTMADAYRQGGFEFSQRDEDEWNYNQGIAKGLQ